jgi:hypothetical protein
MKKYSLGLKIIYQIIAFCSGFCSIGFSLILFFSACFIDQRSPNLVSACIFLAFGAVLLYSCYLVKHTAANEVRRILSGYNFKPTPGYEINRSDIGKYVGFDTVNGTILLFSTYDSLFKGKDISDLSGYEYRHGMIALKFNDVYFPYFVISAGGEAKNMAFCHKLDVLLSSSYKPQSDTGTSFSEFIQQKPLPN